MRLLLLSVFVLGAHSVMLSENSPETEVKEGEEPVGRTLLLLQLLKKKLNQLHEFKQAQTVPPYSGCICVPFYLCSANGTIITDGSGVIDFRNRHCTGDLEVCCYPRMTVPTLPTTQPPPTTTTTTTTTTPRPTIIITLPTTPATLPTTTTTMAPATTRAPIQQVCLCVPIFQCAIASGNLPGFTTDNIGFINPRQQLVSTCNGIFVCCSNAAVTQPPVTSTLPPFTLPNPTTLPTTTTTLLPAIVWQQNCICVLLAACSLGYMPMSNVNNIDPRLLVPRQGQSCSATNSVCCRLSREEPVAQANSLVKFDDDSIKNPDTPNACRCVPVDDCADSDTVSYDINGAIDPRFGPCMSPTLVCCKVQTSNRQRSEIIVGFANDGSASTQLVAGSAGVCGIRDLTYAGITSPSPGASHFAEFPWMALLLIRRAGSSDIFQCGGSLISSRVILTAAHCVVSCDTGTLIARLGEWNTAALTEPLQSQEIGVQRIIVHPQFYQAGLYHDVALVVLTNPATYAINIRPICLPAQGQQFAANTLCYASGWGRNAFAQSGEYQTILRKVGLPIVDNANCQNSLRTTRLGQFFQLHSSFICAGGQPNMDTCYKDGGGPLVCQDPSTGRFTQAGIVSWGIGCGSAAPGVYASVAQHRQWIDQQLAAFGIAS